ALATGDDGTSVPHGAAGRGCASSDEACHRLPAAAPGLVLEELRGILFGGTADFANHDDGFRFRVCQEHLEHVYELDALDRVAADANGRCLAETDIGGLEHRLIGKRSGTGQNAYGARAEAGSGNAADLALLGRQNARAVRAEQSRPGTLKPGLDPDHVEDGNT